MVITIRNNISSKYLCRPLPSHHRLDGHTARCSRDPESAVVMTIALIAAPVRTVSITREVVRDEMIDVAPRSGHPREMHMLRL